MKILYCGSNNGTSKSRKNGLINMGYDVSNFELEKNILKYNRQYFGYINEKGEKVFYINLFKESIDCEMNAELIVLDGCSNYWQISFVLDTQEFKDFSVNGCA